MKIRNIKTTLENLNEFIKYAIFVLALFVIAGFGLFLGQYYLASGELLVSTIGDIAIVVILLALTISARGSVSLRRTTLMILFGFINVYGTISYAYVGQELFTYITPITTVASVFTYIAVAASVLNILILIFRAIILVQYEICTNEGIDQLSKENFKYSFKKSITSLGIRIPILFVYAIIYQGFATLITSITEIIYEQIFDIPYIVFGLVLLVVPIVVVSIIKRKVSNQSTRYLTVLGLFGGFVLTAIIVIIVLSQLLPASAIIIELIYTLGIALIGFGYTFYLFMNEKQKY